MPDSESLSSVLESGNVSLSERQPVSQKIGLDVPIENLFTPDRIQQSQELIQKTLNDLSVQARKNIIRMEETLALAENTPANARAPHMKTIAEEAYTIKKYMEAVGQPFETEIVTSMFHYVEQADGSKPGSLLIISKHIDVLKALMKEKSEVSHMNIRHETMNSLASLIAKLD
jgi:hypothetical protein